MTQDADAPPPVSVVGLTPELVQELLARISAVEERVESTEDGLAEHDSTLSDLNARIGRAEEAVESLERDLDAVVRLAGPEKTKGERRRICWTIQRRARPTTPGKENQLSRVESADGRERRSSRGHPVRPCPLLTEEGGGRVGILAAPHHRRSTRSPREHSSPSSPPQPSGG